MTGCDSCGAADELLFTCSHCEDQFCAAHQFPHHACARFTEAGRAAERAEAADFEFGDGATVLTPTTDDTEDGDAPADSGTTGGESGTDAGGSTGEAVTRRRPDVAVPGPRVEVARDAARETRPDRSGPAPGPPNRGMPWERDAGSVADWMADQSYPDFLVRVGGLSLLLTAAFYGGLAVTLYGYV